MVAAKPEGGPDTAAEALLTRVEPIVMTVDVPGTYLAPLGVGRYLHEGGRVKRWLKRIRGILGMGITWGAAGALAGMAIEVFNGLWPNPLGGVMDIWPVALGLPAFLGGIAFSSVLAVVARSRRFDELSLWKFAALGGLGGLIVGLLPAALHMLGLVPAGFNLWPVSPALVVGFSLGATIVASGTLALARLAEDRERLQSGEGSAGVGLTAGESAELLGDSS